MRYKYSFLPYFYLLLYYHTLDDDILQGTIVLVGLHSLNGLDDFHSLDDLTKDCVLSVEMRSAATYDVVINHLRRQPDAFLCQHGAYLVEVVFGLLLAIDNIELAAAACLLWVDIIGLSRCRQGTTPMIKVRQVELSRNEIARAPIAKHLPRLGIPAVRVASLYHEVLDAAVEERAFVEALPCKFEEIVTVQRRIVREDDADVAHICLDADDVALLLPLGFGGQDAEQEEGNNDEEQTIMFHSV